jgi:predicted site-specific integrase-resolvase
MAAKRVVREIPCINILQVSETSKKLKQVAAYARVSTEKEQQEDSFERQVDHYTQLINNNPEWQMVEVYADPGISGTRAEKRPNFMRMIEDCRAGKIEKILVKSISRFARNTVDALQYIRELQEQTSIIITTNKGFEDWTEFLGDPALATAVLDRLTFRCDKILMDGKSYRLENRKSYLNQN